LYYLLWTFASEHANVAFMDYYEAYLKRVKEAHDIRRDLETPETYEWEIVDLTSAYRSDDEPDTFTESEAEGELADRVREAFGVTDTAPVMIHEVRHPYWLGEYTSAVDYDFILTCNEHTKEFRNGADENDGLLRLLEWLDEKAPKK
jgi:hypothetical protein